MAPVLRRHVLKRALQIGCPSQRRVLSPAYQSCESPSVLPIVNSPLAAQGSVLAAAGRPNFHWVKRNLTTTAAINSSSALHDHFGTKNKNMIDADVSLFTTSSLLVIAPRPCDWMQSRSFSSRQKSRHRPMTSEVESDDDSDEDEAFDNFGYEEGSDLEPESKYEISPTGERGRNKKLANVIRAGMNYLNQTSSIIQSSRSTKIPLLAVASLDSNYSTKDMKTERQLSEENRLFTVITSCLEHMAQKGDGSLTIHGTPIHIVQVEVKPHLRHAVVYWTLPHDVLLSDEHSMPEKARIKERMEQRLAATGGPAGQLQMRVHSTLRHYYAPKLVFRHATKEMMYEVLKGFV